MAGQPQFLIDNLSVLSKEIVCESTISPTDYDPSQVKITIIATVCIVISLISIPCNLFNIIIIYVSPILHNMNNILLCNLLFIDLMNGLIVLPLITVVSLNRNHDYNLCQLQGIILHLNYSASLTASLAITVDRCFAVVNPYRYKSYINKKRCFLIAICTWTVPTILAFLPVLGLHKYGLGKYFAPIFCGTSFDQFDNNHVLQAILNIFIVVITISIITCYTVIFIIAYEKSAQDILGSSNIKKSIRTTSLIVGTNLLCWLPFMIFNLLEYINRNHEISNKPTPFNITSLLLMLSNAAVNPIIYASTNKFIRKRYHQFFSSKNVFNIHDQNFQS
ncbi:uncharacterized protein TRIADDRAFT_29616 [Trichoplax adhaerens]|uniref:G-protein coupled receptors family 1 profile domain-containing protein n=1 Tax=Trichoplax adhaerens TaxID=10228 RepID=B3S5J9_TRIAD|nr:hypothetical protein TRIADDRAFT_29616 [Trichoplax adhaerens]EDV21825.1 hypothetical protein TRIADDRAFT_29616 [Trichoplax adhaerens]|eukprot:XP_002115462.1 hypothetical protein TRIADDRAFT_29616 [Trichoplax adhaerens]